MNAGAESAERQLGDGNEDAPDALIANAQNLFRIWVTVRYRMSMAAREHLPVTTM